MKVKKFSLVFGILFLFLMLISFASALTLIPIDASWGQSSLTYNSGATYYVGVYASITDNVAFQNNYNGEDYCIDIVSGANEFGIDCDLEGTISSANIARFWSVPSSAINKTLTFKFKIPSRGEEVSSDPLTVLQGTTSGLDLEGDCTIDSQCGTDGYSANYCSATGNVVKNFIDYFCSSGTCSSSTSVTPVATCECGCSNAVCISSCSSIDCTLDTVVEKCGADFDSANYCIGNSVYKNRTTYACDSSVCSNSTSAVLVQDCGTSTCSAGACVGVALPPNFDSTTASWWNDALSWEYTNQEYLPSFSDSDSSSTTRSGKIRISGIANANGQTARIDILKLGVSIGQSTVSIISGTATGTWTISKSQIDTTTNLSTFFSKITLINDTYPITKTFSEWMSISIGQSIVCDLTTPAPTLSWGSSNVVISEGASYTATMSGSGINAASGTEMILNVRTIAGALISSQDVTLSPSKTISATNTFSGLSIGTHQYYFTLSGCDPSQTATSGTLTITVEDVTGCSYSIGDGTCCTEVGETCSNEVACGTCAPSFNSASASWLKNGEINISDTILTGSINNIYRMKITGITNAELSTLYFDVYEYDLVGDHEVLQTSISSIISGGEASVSFSIDETTLAEMKEWPGEPPYKLYFKARIGSLTGDFVNNQLELNVADPAGCTNTCGDGICCAEAGEVQGVCILDCGDLPMDISNAIGVWSEDNLSIIEGTSGTRTLSISGITHVPVGGAQIAINLWEADDNALTEEGTTDDKTQTIYVNVQSDGTATTAVTIGPSDIVTAGGNENVNDDPDLSPYEFYGIISYNTDSKSFKDDDILEVFVESTVTCLDINICADYTDSVQCNEDLCEVANASVPEGIDCSDPDTNCYCLWNTTASTCGPGADITDPNMPNGMSSIGSCSFNEDMGIDNCDDGFLSYNWTALWIWEEGNNFTQAYYNALSSSDKLKYIYDASFWRYDPANASSLSCYDGSNIMPCPAQVQLSGFNWVNLVIALAIVALIYWLFSRDKRKKAKQKKRK